MTRMFMAPIPEPREHITRAISMPIVGRMRALHRECALEAASRAASMPWSSRVRGCPILAHGWWVFRGVGPVGEQPQEPATGRRGAKS